MFFSVLMLTVDCLLAELPWMDTPAEHLWMVTRAWCCRTPREENLSSTSLAVTMMWPVPGTVVSELVQRMSFVSHFVVLSVLHVSCLGVSHTLICETPLL